MTILSSDDGWIMLESSLFSRKQFRDFSLTSWSQNFVAGAVLGEFKGWLYLLRALYKTLHVCDADQSWDSFCGAGAIFGEVGGRLLLLCALQMTLQMWCGSIMKFILRCRRSIWWSYSVTLVAPRIVNICDADQSWDLFCVAGTVFGEVGGWLLLLRAV